MRIQNVLAVAFLTVLIAGCANSDSDSQLATTEFSPSTATITMAVFPTRMLEAAYGIVTYENGCFKHGSSLLVWPLDQYSIDIQKDRVIFIDHMEGGKSGEWVFGEEASFGGGTTTQNFIDRFPHQPIPEHCTGTLWLIGGASN